MNTQKSRFRGFTLIELLVVIAIIALLLAIIVPSLKIAQKKAQEVICRSNLKQWGVVFLTYTTENHNKFWVENVVWETGEPQGQWMPILSPYYGEVDKIRLCPSATKPHPNPNLRGLGATFAYWGDTGDGGALIRGHRFTGSQDKNYGSYGINFWITTPDVDNTGREISWRYRPEWQWRGPMMATGSTSRIPMVSDCVWFGTNPENTGVDSSERISVVTSTYWEDIPSSGAIDWSNDIARLLINRHSRGINVCFMDGSVEKVFLWDLLQLKWHKQFRPESLTLSWLNP